MIASNLMVTGVLMRRRSGRSGVGDVGQGSAFCCRCRRSGVCRRCLDFCQGRGNAGARGAQFIAGKHFSYTCFEGTNGNGRIYADGSVAGYIQPGGTGPRRYVVLPTGTLADERRPLLRSVRGLPFEPCFNLDRTSQVSFRGSVSGLGLCLLQLHAARRARRSLRSGYRLRGVRASIASDE